MAAVILFLLLFAWIGLQEVKSHSIAEARLSKIQNRVEKIEDRLGSLAQQDIECNGTINNVTERMKHVSDRVPSLYAGSFL